MSTLVLDTDVASAVLKARTSEPLRRTLHGRRLAITFVTAGELAQWSFLRRWGATRRDELTRFLAHEVIVLPYSRRVAGIWGEIQAHARFRGRPRPVNDSWIAACCLARELPLVTLNTQDFVDYAEHEGLELVG